MLRRWKTYANIIGILLIINCITAPAYNGLVHTHYEATQYVSLPDILPPPPSLHSPDDQKDMAAVLAAQNNRTKEQIFGVKQDAYMTVFRFKTVLGSQFNAKNFPVNAIFFENVIEDEDSIMQLAKAHFARPRPFMISHRVKPLVPEFYNGSYPSGHASFAYVSAILLARMVPEKAPQLFARAANCGHNRIIAGVHFPTDIQAGMISGTVIANALLQDPKFLSDFNQAKNELRHKLMLQESPTPVL